VSKEQVQIPGIAQLSEALIQARKRQAVLQSQVEEIVGAIEKHGAELAAARAAMDKRYRTLSGGLPENDFPEELKVSKLERQGRVLQSRAQECQERLTQGQAEVDNIGAQMNAAWVAFGVEQIRQISTSIRTSALALLKDACRYRAFLGAFNYYVHEHRTRVPMMSGAGVTGQPGPGWVALCGEVAETPMTEHSGAVRGAAGLPEGPIDKYVVPRQFLSVGDVNILVAGDDQSLHVGVDESFFLGENWRKVPGIAELCDGLAELFGQLPAPEVETVRYHSLGSKKLLPSKTSKGASGSASVLPSTPPGTPMSDWTMRALETSARGK